MTVEMPTFQRMPVYLPCSLLLKKKKNLDSRETEEVKCQVRKCTGLMVTIKNNIKGRLHIEARPEAKAGGMGKI